jgi:hypothetical protein
MIRFAALLLVICGSLAVKPAAAQFGGIFGNSQQPPRPPADVPNGSFPAQPPPVQYPGQYQPAPPAQYPGQYQPPPAAASPSGIQSQPLPPPPGVTTAPSPTPGSPPPPALQRARITPQPANPPAPLPPLANPPPPQPADTSPQPDDTVVTETPTQKIANDRAVFSGLDKITGRIISFDAAVGETVQFGALQVTARACYTRPPTEATNTDAFVEVDEVTLKGEIKRIFTGWMFAASPGLHAVEHPIYDVWLTDCAAPQGGAVAQTAVQPPLVPAPAAARARQAVPPPRRPVTPPPDAPVTND